MKIHEDTNPVFPTSMVMAGIAKGEVRIAVAVDARGKPTDTLVLAYTHPAFLRAAMEALEDWTFEPAVVRGEARATICELTFTFEPDGIFVAQNNKDRFMEEFFSLPLEGGMYGYEISRMRDLDRIPAPIHIVKIGLPTGVGKPSQETRITVDFYIDEKGNVRLPSLSRSEDSAMGWAAVAAVGQWQFAPPTVNGAPVTVHASQDFVFRP